MLDLELHWRRACPLARA